MSDLNTPRSGHGCTYIPGEDHSIIVTGGTKGFGEAAMESVEIYNTETKSWTHAGGMTIGRFGHAVVTVGDKIFAIGGDGKNPHNIMDTIEEYDVVSKSWKIIEKRLNKAR